MSSDIQKVSTTSIEPKKPLTIQELIQKSAEQLGKALPDHMKPERIVRLALTTLRLNPKLYECDPQSILGALFQAAALGVEPNVNSEAWIVPYSVKGKKVAQFQLGVGGYIKLFWNHKNAVGLIVETVCEKDEFEYDLGNATVRHKHPPFNTNRGKAVGYYAKADLANGGKVVKVISRQEAEDFAKRFSKCWDKDKKEFIPGTPWRDHFDEMAKKTVIKQLMKLMPKSVEIQNALQMDETVKTKLDVNMVEVPDENDHEYAETVPVEEVKPEQLPVAKPAPASSDPADPNYGVTESNELMELLKRAKGKDEVNRVFGQVNQAHKEGKITEQQYNELCKFVKK